MSQAVDDEDDDDHGLDEDMEALRRACMLTGTHPADLDNHNNNNHQTSDAAAAATATTGSSSFDSDSDDDLELIQNIQKRFSITADLCQPLSMSPLSILPPVGSYDDSDDDFETLRAIQRRFSAYDCNSLKNCMEELKKPKESCASSVASEKDIGSDLFVNASNTCERFQDNEDSCNSTLSNGSVENQPSHLIEWHQSVVCKQTVLPQKVSTFPKSAQLLVDAIKKNRSCQKFLRSKLIQVEAKIEENKKLKERVKILKDFQAACRRKTGRALSQKKDPRVQLISAQKLRTSKDSKANDKRVSAMYYGPAENSHVANYRMALTKFPLSVERKKWSKTEKENLGKGIRQQFQEMMLQISRHQFSTPDEALEDSNNSWDDIVATIKNIELTPEKIREFLPKVNWEQLAFMYFVGRSGSECETRWLNHEDPLINRTDWIKEDDKMLLHIVQEMGINNWFEIAKSLGTSRTPFQCIARYQRSLNASVLKSKWTEDEDVLLCAYVEALGESNWQSVASMFEGRTGTQCSNRWKKTLHPARTKKGKWELDEDKQLIVATMFFGPQNWKKIAQYVAGRTQVQCRERWVNSLDPSVNFSKWTVEEDSRLKAAILEHGYCWSKVAACVRQRTDNQCWRRWKVLFPDEVPLLRAAKKIKKVALISNFVDRESERPALGPNDFVPLPVICSISEADTVKSSRKQKRTTRGRKKNSGEKKDASSRNTSGLNKSKRHAKDAEVYSEGILDMTKNNAVQRRKSVNKRGSAKNRCIKSVQDESSLIIITGKEDVVSGGRTNGDGVEALGGITALSNKRKRVSKRHSKSKVCSTEVGENQSSVPSSGKSMLSGATNDTELMHGQELNSLVLNNVGGIDVSDSDSITRKKRVPKVRSKKKICTRLDEDGMNMSPPENSELRMADGGGVENIYVDQNASSEKNMFLKKYHRRDKSTQLSGKCQDSVLVPCQKDSIQKSETSDKCSSGLILTTEGDDITLACFLQTKLKKRRLEMTRNADQAYVKSSKDHKLDGKTRRCFNVGSTENLIPCNMLSSRSEDKPALVAIDKDHGKVDQVSDGNVNDCGPVKESVVSYTRDDEAVDTTLACFLKKLKKKPPQLHESSC